MSELATNPEVVAVRLDAAAVVVRAKVLTITNDDEYRAALSMISQIAESARDLEKRYRKIKDPIVQAGKEADSLFAEPRAKYEEARAVLDRATRIWRQKLEEEQRAAQKKIDDERRALEAKAEADRVAAEKLAQEAEAKATKASEGGDLLAELEAAQEQEAAREQVAEANAKAVQVATAPAPFVPPPAKTEKLDTGAKVSFTKVWTFVVTDPGAVPRQYCQPVDSLIRSAVKAGAREIPGVSIYAEERSSAR